jgi:hypothetical protein
MLLNMDRKTMAGGKAKPAGPHELRSRRVRWICAGADKHRSFDCLCGTATFANFPAPKSSFDEQPRKQT